MPKIVKPLSFSEVDKAKVKDKEYRLSDGGGLFLRVRLSGTKDWIFRYQAPITGKRSDISFGAFPTVGLADARAKREEAKVLLSKNIDPKNHKKEQLKNEQTRLANTLKEVAAQWFKVKENEVTPDYAEDIWRSLTLHVFPAMGDIPISNVNATDTILIIKPLEAKGSLETVKRVCQRLNEVMVFAVNTGLIQSNPLSGIKAAFKTPQKKNFPTLKPNQLPMLMRALSTASIKIVTRCLIEWQLHTMVRPSEAAQVKWSDIDFENKTWTVARFKNSHKTDYVHIVPLSDQALSILDFIQPLSGKREYVFPADRDPKRHTNEQTANMALKRMGFEKVLVAHGLRSIASTALNEHGFDPDVIESCLAHIDKNEVRRAYNRADYLERRRVVMAYWSNFIEQAAKGNTGIATSNITQLKMAN
ncbi:integrase domain-containing protein [Alteromonas sp. RKMC-009]|uniref:integrase domain-containing protein n=1 Tax=Alteromonas sp. RKMC-009 TaxID=2267264 RepID=UPI000E68CF77|nr:integrase domain-containing protein [Alteromonas sp. RKMC-009]AYA64180.1 DUF4102 domain-containing protein [Alteromonas sp. RKMC-009]